MQALGHMGPITAVGVPTNYTLDATNDGIAWVFVSETSDPITRLWFRYGARTGTPPTFRISLQALDASGNPDGTVLGGGSPASVTFTPPADTSWDGTGRWITLDNAYTPTRGQLLASVIEWSSGTIDASNSSSFSRTITGSMNVSVGLPNAVTEVAGVWGKHNFAPGFAYGTATQKFGRPIIGVYTATSSVVGNRRTMAFTMPSGIMSTYQLSGVVFTGRLGSAGTTVKIAVWDTSGAVIAETATIDCDASGSITNAVNTFAFFNSLVTLTAGTKYYIGAEILTSGSTGVLGLNLSEASDRQCYPMGEQRLLATWNGSAWTETDTVLPLVELIFEDITVPSGGGETSFISIG